MLISAPAGAAEPAPAATPAAREVPAWPEGSQVLPFENVEGAILLRAALSHGGRDTSGLFLLDTGSGFLALDHALAEQLGLEAVASDDSRAPIVLLDVPLERFDLGELSIQQLRPLLGVRGEIVRLATDRPVLGLIGQALFRSRALGLDFDTRQLSIVPLAPPVALDPDPVATSRAALAVALEPGSRAIRFQLRGDGKIVVRGTLTNGRHASAADTGLVFIVDTGATKSVLFTPALEEAGLRANRWPALEGLRAPTLAGSEAARLVRVPAWSIGDGRDVVTVTGLDATIIGGPLGERLSRDVGARVTGLLGYSFLRRFRVMMDFAHEVLWLTPRVTTPDERPDEYSTIGLQLERNGGDLRIAAVARRSPAARARLLQGDRLQSIDGKPTHSMDLAAAGQALEGAPGTRVTLQLLRGATELRVTLTRRRLL